MQPNLRRNVPSSGSATPTDPARRGFTLVEILIVVTILAILAALVVPQFAGAAKQSRENSLKADLYRIRVQLEVYKNHHTGEYPPQDRFEEVMTRATNANHDSAGPGTDGFPFGPYLKSMPNNPMTGRNTLGNGDVGSSDWYYNAVTGDFRANDSAASRQY